MPRIPTRLSSDMAIRKLKPKPDQKHPVRYAVAGEPAGLYIQVTPNGAKSWLLRVTTGTRPHPTSPGVMTQIRREFGLGTYPLVSLQGAREKAAGYLAKTSQGVDPNAERRAAISAAQAAQAKLKTFAECERSTLEAKAPGYKNEEKSKAEWRTRMDLHVLPAIGTRVIGNLTVEDVAGVLEPLWRTKYPTAKKLLHDIAAVFRYAKAKKLYLGENPATSEALEPLLGKPNHKKRHFPSLPYERVPEFLGALRNHRTDASRALEFAILTASRSDEVRSAPWPEFDIKKKLWTIPAKRMKRGRDHRVPLSNQAIEILEQQRGNGSAYPFSNTKGEPLSDMALSMLVKRMHEASLQNGGKGFVDPGYNKIAVPHGFRSSFKDWARNLNRYADELSELALAHVNSDSTRAAYARDELLGPRTGLMQDWANYCQLSD
jgi:integrase